MGQVDEADSDLPLSTRAAMRSFALRLCASLLPLKLLILFLVWLGERFSLDDTDAQVGSRVEQVSPGIVDEGFIDMLSRYTFDLTFFVVGCDEVSESFDGNACENGRYTSASLLSK